jgi:hypothetical protein
VVPLQARNFAFRYLTGNQCAFMEDDVFVAYGIATVTGTVL